VTFANVNTNGRLLEIAGAGTAIFNGTVSGAGGLAISGQRTELNGNNTYTGNTWIHAGRLHVTGDISASAAIRIGTLGSLSGAGVVSTLYGSGSIHPGQSPGILTASAVDLSEGLNFFFEFTQLAPEYGSSSASGNDVLYLTHTTPFLGNFSSANDINIFLNLADEPTLNSRYEGGFFVIVNPENLSISISDANFNYFIVDPEGAVSYDNINYRQYDGPLSFSVAWAARSALFEGNAESVDGYSLKITAVPEPASLLLPLLALLFALKQGRFRPHY
jgi:autotransporter-associated beta strand protein